jgi:hypothetical protein
MGLRSDVFNLKSSSQVAVGAGNSSTTVDLSVYDAGAVFINVTAKTGTFTDWLFGLQVSMDGGTTWSGIGAASTSAVGPGSVGAAADLSATGKYWFAVNSYAGPLARLAWITAGGTNLTFSASAVFRR